MVDIVDKGEGRGAPGDGPNAAGLTVLYVGVVVALLRGRSHEDLVEMELAELAARNAAQATAGGAHRSAAGRAGDGS